MLIERIFGHKISTNEFNGAGFRKPSGLEISIVPPSSFEPLVHFDFTLTRAANDGSGPVNYTIKQLGKPDYKARIIAGEAVLQGYNGSGSWVKKSSYNLLTSPVTIEFERSVPVFFNTDLKA